MPFIKGKKRSKSQEEVWKVTGSTRGVRGNSDGTNAKQNAAVRLNELEAENKALRKREKATRRAANLAGAASIDGSKSPTAWKQEKIRLRNRIYSSNRRNQLLRAANAAQAARLAEGDYDSAHESDGQVDDVSAYEDEYVSEEDPLPKKTHKKSGHYKTKSPEAGKSNRAISKYVERKLKDLHESINSLFGENSLNAWDSTADRDHHISFIVGRGARAKGAKEVHVLR